MIRRFLGALTIALFCHSLALSPVFATPAPVQLGVEPSGTTRNVVINQGGTPYTTGQITPGSSSYRPMVNGFAAWPSPVVSNAEMSSRPSTSAPFVTRLGISAVGDAPPATYAPSATCPYGGTQPDGGACIATSDGKYWVLQAQGVFDIRTWGGKADGGTTDNKPVITQVAAAVPSGSTVTFPASGSSCYAVNGTPTIPNLKSIYFTGDGPEATQILETSTTGSPFPFTNATNVAWSGGGVSNMSIKAGSTCFAAGSYPPTIYSSGTAVNIQGGNNHIFASRLHTSGFAVGLNLDNTWQGMFGQNYHFHDGIGTQVGCNASYPQGAGNHFTDLLNTNNGISSAGVAGSIGFKLCSGGQYLTNTELGGFVNGLVVRPGAGQLVEGLRLTNVIADNSWGDGMIFDGTNGNIIGATGKEVWSSFNNGRGVVVMGPSGSVSLSLDGHFRENGGVGVDNLVNGDVSVTGEISGNARGQLTLVSGGLGCQAGDIVKLVGGTYTGSVPTQVSILAVDGSGTVQATNGFSVNAAAFYSSQPSNPVSTTGPFGTSPDHCTTHPTFNITWAPSNAGVHVGANVSHWSFKDDIYGNVGTNSTSQAANIVIDAGSATDCVYKGNRTRSPAPSSGIAAVVNNSTTRCSWDDTLYSATPTVAANTTTYLGPAGINNTPGISGWNLGPGTIVEYGCGTPYTPGSGQTYTVTPYVNGATAGTATTIANGSYGTGSGTIPQSIPLTANSNAVQLQITTSATATPTTFVCYLAVAR